MLRLGMEPFRMRGERSNLLRRRAGARCFKILERKTRISITAAVA